MPITTDDVDVRYSVATGPGSSTAQTDPNASLGGYVSTTPWAGVALQDLFGPFTGVNNAAGTPTYRCVFVVNTHDSLTLTDVRAYVTAQVAGAAEVSVGADQTAASLVGAAAPQAATIGGETLAPAGVTFSTASTYADGVSLGDIPPGGCKAMWIKVYAAGASPQALDGATIAVTGDTV